MTASVTRLPVQHKDRPHCPACKADVPTLDDYILHVPVAPPSDQAKVFAITFHMRCACGQLLDLRKTIRGTSVSTST